MYMVTAIIFLLISGSMAAVMRLQLAVPNNDIVGPATYNRLFTMHGTTMVFLVGMPIVAGMSNYLIPLMIGARDMAFPRLNAFGYWVFLFGGLLLYFSYLGGEGLYGAGSAPDVGWFAYSPLTERPFSPGSSTDYWILGILVSGIGSIASSINVIATTFCMRCKGMTLSRMPLFVWIMVVDAWMILIALPPLTAAQIMLLIDRFLGGNFFNTLTGGSAVLWQHFFWIFGHPEVYILIFPAFASLSEVIPVFSRKPIFGRAAMVGAAVGIGFISTGVWAHHMFSVGMSPLRTYSSRHPPCWLRFLRESRSSTGWPLCTAGRSLRHAHAVLHRLPLSIPDCRIDGRDVGRSAVRLAVDRHLLCSCSLPLHPDRRIRVRRVRRHLLLVSKGTRQETERENRKWHFWLFVIGFHLTFDPQHFAGFLGMPRRVYTYPAGRGWESWNLVSSIGAAVQVASFACFAWNIIYSMRKAILPPAMTRGTRGHWNG